MQLMCRRSNQHYSLKACILNNCIFGLYSRIALEEQSIGCTILI